MGLVVQSRPPARAHRLRATGRARGGVLPWPIGTGRTGDTHVTSSPGNPGRFKAISSTLDLKAVLNTIVARATELSGTDAGVVYEYDEQREVFVPRATERLDAEIVETMLATPVRKGEGATGHL